jgi:beta-fructofuranosidase
MESRNRFASDRHRPSYHFLPAANWLNDPNGLIQWQGQVHLFYQYNPHGPFHGAIHWGHAASRDLIHWEDWPVALAPTPGGPDQDGCWSGCAVDDGGKPVLVYTGGQCAEGGLLRQTQCLAMSDDGLHTWRKYPGNPVIASPPVVDGQALAHPADFRDPWVWREADGWYMAVGTWIRRAGGAVLLYRSPDLVHWEYLHPLLEGDTPGEMWECPNFFPLGDKYVLLVSLQPEFRYSEYYIGTYADHRFMPERRGIVDFGGYFYAPQTLLDERGRRLIWGWVQEGRSGQVQREAGWSGVMSLPRVLTLRPDGALGIAPAPELQTLRRKHTRLGSLEIAPDSAGLLPGLRGDCLEIVAEFRPGTASQCGLTLRRSPDGTEQTDI